MYTTLSPCPMCAGAAILFGIKRVVLGENRTFVGGESELLDYGVEVVNLGEAHVLWIMQMRHYTFPYLTHIIKMR